MTTLQERQQLLDELSRLAGNDVSALWNQLSNLSNEEFVRLLQEAFPEIAGQYAAAAAELSAEWYAESDPDLPYQPTSFLPATEGLPASVSWALSATGEAAIPRLEGIVQRQVYQGSRMTIIRNSLRESGSTWARVARPGACAFCAVMASRGAVYSTKAAAEQVVGRGRDISTNFRADGSRKSGGQAKGVKARGRQQVGDKFHDNCHCQAKEVRPGQIYEPPDYVQQWNDAYKDASGAGKQLPEILSEMRTALGTH